MRKVQLKNMKKRGLSVLLMLCLVIAMFPAEDLLAAAKRVTKDANENTITSEYNNLSNAKTLDRERKVYKNASTAGVIADSSKPKGTAKNPFVILEVVTYPDYASIGYLVDGCEPIDMDSLRGNAMAIKDLTGSENGGDFFGFGTFKKANGTIYFFEDEVEGQVTFYQNTNLTDVEQDGVAPKKSELRFSDVEWGAKKKTEAKTLYGYYEVVEKGKGTFILKQEPSADGEGTVRSIVQADKLNPSEVAQTTLVWHTVNNYLLDQYKAEGVYSDRLFLSMENLNSSAFDRLKIDSETHPEYVGNRFYTTRNANTSNVYVDVTGCLYVYESNDLFVKKSLGKSNADAKKYSVTVKTITPSELALPANQDWVDIADLVYFNCDLKIFKNTNTNNVKDENEAALIDLWQSKNINDETLNRYNLVKSTDSTKGFRGANEVDGNIVYKILKRITKNKGYLALIIDSVCVDSNYTDTKSGVTYGRYMLDDRKVSADEYVRDKIDGGYGETGYKNNLAKLWLACTSANPGISQKCFFDGGLDSSGGSFSTFDGFNNTSLHPKRATISENILVFTDANTAENEHMSEDEKLWWSGMSFYCADDRYTGSENSYRDIYWKNYAGDTTHATFDGANWVTDDRYYVQGHVFVTPTGKALVDGYTDAYDSSSINISEDKYEDFNNFLIKNDGASFKANHAQPYRAVKYIIDPNEVVSYYFDDSINVLDIEPSVKIKEDGVNYEWVFDGSDVIKMIPKRIGSDTKIKNIEHQVMQQFVSKNEDLNSKYDLIYIGDDIGGLWTGYDTSAYGFATVDNTKFLGTREIKINHEEFIDWSHWNWYREGEWAYFQGDPQGYRQAKRAEYRNYWPYYCFGEGGFPYTPAYTETKTLNIYLAKDAYAGMDRTDFVDNSMDGLVYFHIGDQLYVNDDDRSGGGHYTDDATFVGGSGDITRQAGNDLTYKKMNALIAYLGAEYPIVVADTLYGNEGMTRPYVDQSPQCVLRQFLGKYDPEGSETYTYYTKDMLDSIDAMVSNRLKGRATIVSGPKIYDSSDPLNSRYLDAPGGIATLTFKVKVPNTTDYAYRVFVDRNKDSVFKEDWTNDEKNEVITAKMVPLTQLDNEISVRMPDKWVGFVQWRIEVVNKNNILKRYSMEGCSAVKADTSAGAPAELAKQKIVALQIIPSHGTKTNASPGTLVDLSNVGYDGKKTKPEDRNNSDWQDLYDQVNDFDIAVLKITWWQFMQLFKKSHDDGNTFKYDMGSPIDITSDTGSNPNKTVVHDIESTPIAFDNINDKTLNTVPDDDLENYFTLSDFNMIVLGFDDTYGFTDMSNYYGSVEYLYYFAQKGCSILFTHDTTSPVNWKDTDPFNLGWKNLWDYGIDSDQSAVEVRRYGYTGNNMMREIMGMNRYMRYSQFLTSDTDPKVNFRENLARDIKNFVINSDIKYDEGYDGISKDGLQGYTVFNLMRYICTNYNNGSNGRIQNKYMVINPKTGSLLKSDAGKQGGAYNDGGNTMSEVVSKVNEGQITQYPFTIGAGTGTTDFLVGDTHGQWFQLNMEDEDLTVWYTLQDPAFSSLCPNNDYRTRTGDWQRISLMYSAVPQDAVNNYYIYSKGNIFYSGVGHSAVHDGEEQKLFVNTLVAAYRPKFGLPFVQVTSEEANLTSNSPRTYTVTLPVDYLYKEDGTYAGTEVLLGESDFTDSTHVYVKFKAMDNNGCTVIYTKAYYEGTTEEVAIYSSLENAKSGANTGMTYRTSSSDYELTVRQEYYIKYPKSYLNGSKTSIVFESTNNRVMVGEYDTTKLQFKSQPLFKLD